MHQHFTDMFEATHLGIRSEERAYDGAATVMPGGPGKYGPASSANKPADEKKPKDDAKSASDAKPKDDKKSTSPATAQVKAAVSDIVRDGSISKAEQSKVGSKDAKRALTELKDKLTASVAKADSAKVSNQVNFEPVTAPSEHQARVAKLEKGSSVADLEKAIADDPTENRKELLAERLKEEHAVADVIKDRVALIGTLEAEKVNLAEGPKAAKKVLQDDAVEKAFGTFTTNDGQVHTGNVFGDKWEKISGDAKQDKLPELAEHFRKHPELLDSFLTSQGEGDGAIKDAGSAENHADKLDAEGKFDEATKVRERYKAAKTLKDAFEEYNANYKGGDNLDAKIAGIDTQITSLKTSIKADKKVLSDEVKKEVNAYIGEPSGTESAADADTDTTEVGNADGGAAPGGATGGTDPEVGNADGGAAPGGADPEVGNADGGAAPGGDTSTSGTTGSRTIDYSTPVRQAEVLAAAQQAGLLPPNTAFGADGQATYTVQRGDSYWSIAAASSAGGFDAALFTNALSTNVAALGREANPALIYTGEQLVLPGRSVTDLVTALGLPAQEEYQLSRGDAASQARYEGQAEAEANRVAQAQANMDRANQAATARLTGQAEAYFRAQEQAGAGQ